MRSPLARGLAWAVGLLWCGVALAAPASAPGAAASAVSAPPAQAVAQRVVSLAPHLTELVYAAGGGSKLLAVSRYSDYPAAAQKLPVIGDAFTLDYEELLRLKPDLILAWKGGTPKRQLDKLRELKLPVREIDVQRIDDVSKVLREFGTWMGTQPQADAAANAYDAQIAQLRARYAGLPQVPVFYEIWDVPLMTVGRQHVIDEAIHLCGGSNIFHALDAITATVSRESVVARKPAVIVTGDSLAESAARMRRGWQRMTQVPAVANNRIATIDGDLLNRMGPRLAQGVAALCAAIDSARQAH
ncbi:MAG: cobalamin-binding protein [Betaproteobacteria bacterium]|nr:cobalamin-binding protein [Betaproteobacteria bacterium]